MNFLSLILVMEAFVFTKLDIKHTLILVKTLLIFIACNLCSLTFLLQLHLFYQIITKNEFYRVGSKMLTRSFKPKILYYESLESTKPTPQNLQYLFFFFFFFVENQLKSKFQPIIYRCKIYGVNTLSIIWIYIYIYIYNVFDMYIYDCMHQFIYMHT